MTDLLPCREAFEKWLTADGNYPHLKHKNFGGGYLNDEAAMKWDGWKTAWNTRANKPAALDEKIKRYEDALHYLIERADDSNDARYGTLSASFVRDVCSKALEGTE